MANKERHAHRLRRTERFEDASRSYPRGDQAFPPIMSGARPESTTGSVGPQPRRDTRTSAVPASSAGHGPSKTRGPRRHPQEVLEPKPAPRSGAGSEGLFGETIGVSAVQAPDNNIGAPESSHTSTSTSRLRPEHPTGSVESRVPQPLRHTSSRTSAVEPSPKVQPGSETHGPRRPSGQPREEPNPESVPSTQHLNTSNSTKYPDSSHTSWSTTSPNRSDANSVSDNSQGPLPDGDPQKAKGKGKEKRQDSGDSVYHDTVQSPTALGVSSVRPLVTSNGTVSPHGRFSYTPGDDHHHTHRDASEGTEPEHVSGVENLRRNGSERKNPQITPGRGPSDASHMTRRKSRGDSLYRGNSRRSESRHAGRMGTDSSASRISTLRSRSSDESRSNQPAGLFGAWSKLHKKGTKTGTKTGTEEDTRMSRLKEKIIDHLKKVANYVKPIGHDAIENTAAYGRMIPHIASFLAPAAIMALWAWDSVQYVETNKETCQDLLEGAAEQHALLLDAVDICMKDRNLSIKDLGPLETALDKHSDACHAIYRAVLAQKNQRYIKRFIQRKKIGETELTNASSKLTSAKEKFTFLTTVSTWSNVVSGNKTARQMISILQTWESEHHGRDSSRQVDEPEYAALCAIIETGPAYNVLADPRQRTEQTSRQAKALGEVLTLGTKIRTLKKEMEEMEESDPDGLTSLISSLEKQRKADTIEMKSLEKKKAGRPWNGDNELRRIFVEHRLKLYNSMLQGRGMKDQGTQTQTQTDGNAGPPLTDPNRRERGTSTSGRGTLTGDRHGHLGRRISTTGTVDYASPVGPRQDPQTGSSVHHGRERRTMGTVSQGTGTGTGPATRSVASIYEKSLTHNFPIELGQPLWTPSDVKVGYVGYIDEHGAFKLLFDAMNLGRHDDLRRVPSFPKIPSHKITRRSVVTDEYRKIPVARSRFSRSRNNEPFVGELREKSLVKNMYKLPSTALTEHAVIITETPVHTYFNEKAMGEIMPWFNRAIDAIVKAYTSHTKDKIILVTGTLTASNWGLLVTRKRIREPIYFCELKSDPKSKWGFYTIGGERVHRTGDPAIVSKISQRPDRKERGKDTVLLSRLRFPDTEGIVGKECTPK